MAKDFSHIEKRIKEKKIDLALVQAKLETQKVTEELIRERNIILVDIRTLEDRKLSKGKNVVSINMKIYGNINLGTEE